MRRPVNVGECHVRPGVHRVDGGGFRRLRPDSEVGRGTVIENVIGLVLAVLIAVFLFAALLFPERF
ncbi:ATPase [Mycolicibacterium tusciae]|uniref:ATPase n=1 Tax=Mycolicibacterium tusciae TaxID=75922 RepID=A0A1X0JNW7_9MYCO|nr:ATPase [Mycolicibacterium tusciae]